VSTTTQLVCAYCHQPIEADQAHVRQARLELDGSARKGEFDAYHVRPCYLELYGIDPPPAPQEPSDG